MKIAFLDIDGVCNSKKFFMAQPRVIESTEELRALGGLDPHAITLLNELMEESGVVFVLSSVWRMNYSLTQIQRYFDLRGFEGDFLAATPIYWGQTTSLTHRGLEIQKWLNMLGPKNQPESFVIIDDSSDMAHLMDHLVRVPNDTGLAAEHITQALEILNK